MQTAKDRLTQGLGLAIPDLDILRNAHLELTLAETEARNAGDTLDGFRLASAKANVLQRLTDVLAHIDILAMARLGIRSITDQTEAAFECATDLDVGAKLLEAALRRMKAKWHNPRLVGVGHGLPAEIWGMLFSQAVSEDVSTLSSISLVCKAWSDIAKSLPIRPTKMAVINAPDFAGAVALQRALEDEVIATNGRKMVWYLRFETVKVRFSSASGSIRDIIERPTLLGLRSERLRSLKHIYPRMPLDTKK